eukprot:11634940-Alexandrium_andersonii.AAC.1
MWCSDELQHLTVLSARWLTVMLRLVEAGWSWPRQLTKSRTVFLGKGDGSETGEPYGFRLLAITSL